jgi:hypothetical protein
VTLTPGTNTIAAYAEASSGNLSATDMVKCVYVQSATLAVQTNGSGTFSPKYNGATLQIGVSFSITAKAATGFGFESWTDGQGDILTNGPTLKFVMESNLTLIANFDDLSVPTLKIATSTAAPFQLLSITGDVSAFKAVRTIRFMVAIGPYPSV